MKNHMTNDRRLFYLALAEEGFCIVHLYIRERILFLLKLRLVNIIVMNYL